MKKEKTIILYFFKDSCALCSTISLYVYFPMDYDCYGCLDPNNPLLPIVYAFFSFSLSSYCHIVKWDCIICYNRINFSRFVKSFGSQSFPFGIEFKLAMHKENIDSSKQNKMNVFQPAIHCIFGHAHRNIWLLLYVFFLQ